VRIYAAADLHAKTSRIDRVCSSVVSHDPDVIVIAGDISNYLNPGGVLTRLSELRLPVLVVRGNSDLTWHEKCFQRYPRIFSLHMKKKNIGDVPFAGISGTIPVPFRSRIAFFENHLLVKAAHFISRETILVVHPPPFGTLDRVLGKSSAGSKAVSKLISLCKPRVVICGHIHEDTGIETVDHTLVVNCSIAHGGNGAIIDLHHDPGTGRIAADATMI
jgi:uncharacterized protein